MRILQVTEAAASGTLEIVRTLTRHLDQDGHSVALAHGRRPESPVDPGAGLPASVDVFELPWSERSLRAQVAAARALRTLAARWRPDVVHLHSSFAGAVGAWALADRVPCIYTPHGYALARRGDGSLRVAAYRAVEWATARRCALVGAVSQAEADVARRMLRAPRVAVVENGIEDLDHGRLPAPAVREQPLVVGMGRVGPARRPEGSARILAAAAHHADVRWLGAAPAGEDAPLRAAGVPVSGWLAREQALAQLGKATVLLHWSEWDGQPLAVLEAFARDVVVVASDIAPNRELLGAAQVRSSEREAGDLIARVLTDAGVRERLLAAQRHRRGRFSAEKMAARWSDVYLSQLHGTA